MQTTIQVEKSTVQMLDRVKQKIKAKSYNETIVSLIKKNEKIPDSLFGAHPTMKSFKRDEADFHEL